MVSLVFILGGFNMALGFGLAVGLEQFPRLKRRWRKKKKHAAAAEVQKVVVKKIVKKKRQAPPAPAPLSPEELPPEWSGALAEEAVAPTSFVEATAQVLRLDIEKHREQLLEIDAGVRDASADQLRALCSQLDAVNRDWLAKQSSAAAQLTAKHGSLGTYEAMGLSLESTLREQTAQIKTIGDQLQTVDLAAKDAAENLAAWLARLIDLAHVLRELTVESLVSIAVAENKLGALDRKLQTDPQTAMPNRFGMEALLQDWWRDDPSRQKLVSCVLIDLDGTAQLNQQFGARRVDGMLAGIGRWLEDQLRHDRGCDRIARVGGQAFLLFLGDTGPRNASIVAERIRQSLEATKFEIGEQSFSASATFAVVEIEKRDTSARMWERLRSTLHFSRAAGRNRTALEENGRATAVDPPQFQVKPRVVRLADE